MTELLENPNFKLGTDARGSENFLISKVLSAVNPENYQLAKAGLTGRNVNLYSLSGFLKGVTAENQSVAGRILKMASKETSLPSLTGMNSDAAVKYLDEISKLSSPKAKSLYIEGMSELSGDKIDDVLQIIRTAKPEDARYASSIISGMGRGLTKAQAEKMVQLIKQSGRNLSVNDAANISVLGTCDEIPVSKFLQRILNNKSIPDSQLQDLTCRYIKVSQKINQASFDIPTELMQKYQKKLINEDEFCKLTDEIAATFKQKQETLIQKLPDMYERLLQNKSLTQADCKNIFSQISIDNADIIEKFALNPKALKINFSIATPKNISKLEKLADMGVPRDMQEALWTVIKNPGNKEKKYFEVIQNLLKRDPEIAGRNVRDVLLKINDQTIKYTDDILQRQDLSISQIGKLLDNVQRSANPERIIKLVRDKSLRGEDIPKVLDDCVFNLYEKNPELVRKALDYKVDLQVLNPKATSFFGSSNVAISPNMVFAL